MLVTLQLWQFGCISTPHFYISRFTQHAGIPPHTAARFSRILLEEKRLVPIHEAAGRQSAICSFEPLLQLVLQSEVSADVKGQSASALRRDGAHRPGRRGAGSREAGRQ